PLWRGMAEEGALPVLLRRPMADLGIYMVRMGQPIRRPRGTLLSEDGFRGAIQVARLKPEARGVLVVFDLDDDCARDIVPKLLGWGQPAGSIDVRRTSRRTPVDPALTQPASVVEPHLTSSGEALPHPLLPVIGR